MVGAQFLRVPPPITLSQPMHAACITNGLRLLTMHTRKVALRQQMQRGIVVIPKSVKEARIAQNIDLDFEIDAEDIAKLVREMHTMNPWQA